MLVYRPPKSSCWGHAIKSQPKLDEFFEAYFERVEHDQPGTRVVLWKASVLPDTDWPEAFLKPEARLLRQMLFIVRGNRLMFPMGIVFPISAQEPAAYEFLRRFSRATPFKMSPKHFQVGIVGKSGKLAWRKPDEAIAGRLEEILV